MNCFQARQDFQGFWRKELAPERRADFSAHLRGCRKCDEAFRIFALTAPVLHSHVEPSRPASIQRIAFAARGESRSYRNIASPWMSIAAVLALFITGASAAYYSVATTPQTLSEAIHQPSQFVELVSADMPEANSDLGQ